MLSDQECHDFHRCVDVGEEILISLAKVVQTRFSTGSLDDPIFGTSPVTGETYFTVTAIFGQLIQFVTSKLNLAMRRDQFDKIVLLDIA